MENETEVKIERIKLRQTLRKPWDSLFARLRGYLLTGIVVTAPIFLTIYFTWIFLLFIDARVTPFIPPRYNPNQYLPFSMPGLGLIIVLAFFIIVGWLAKNFFGKLLIGLYERILFRVPVISPIYKAIKQVFETVMSGQAQAFRDVVMFEFPRPGMWTVGFITGVMKGEAQFLADDELVTVLVPTALNPTSGFLLFVPRKDLRILKMTVEQAIKLIISGGLVAPPPANPVNG